LTKENIEKFNVKSAEYDKFNKIYEIIITEKIKFIIEKINTE
jgi:hypothetical protein